MPSPLDHPLSKISLQVFAGGKGSFVQISSPLSLNHSRYFPVSHFFPRTVDHSEKSSRMRLYSSAVTISPVFLPISGPDLIPVCPGFNSFIRVKSWEAAFIFSTMVNVVVVPHVWAKRTPRKKVAIAVIKKDFFIRK